MPKNEKQIFDAAIGIKDAALRAQYLDATCHGDAVLRRRVESLLRAASGEGSFLQKRAADSFGATLVQDDSDGIGQTIERYKLLEKIGEGGFGDVYMAEQREPVTRKVALKIIKPGMDSKQVIARFEAERQALALMEHPHIGKFLDAGETASGRPYFVMELVRGVPVNGYCQQRRLSTRERLELFIEICGAVGHAHQKGIIHRDIKPTNVLVYNNGQRPAPKIIDFGIAKATQGRLTDKTLFTHFDQFIGTPAYMSPEQAQMSGVDVDTRSDIYSLGVLLYELLTGRTPLSSANLRRERYEEICRRIRDDDAPPPSKRVSTLAQAELTTLAHSQRIDPTHVASRLRGDLDWIVMKALEKDRNERYQTADALAADVQRHLDHVPVSAGPRRATYYVRKLLRRHRAAAATVLAFAGLLVLGTVVSVVGWSQAVGAKQDLAAQVTATSAALAESNESREQAQEATKLAESARDQAARIAYLADMQAAHQALQLNNLGLARAILERHRHYDSSFDPRHWEWRALWARCRGNAEKSMDHGRPVRGLSIHPDGKLVAAGGQRLCVLDIFTGNVVRDFPIQGFGVARFTRDGSRLYTIDESGTVRAWRVPSFEPADLVLSHEVPFDVDLEMQVAPDGTWLATFSGRNAGSITIWDVQSQVVKRRIPTSYPMAHLAFFPDSSKLAFGGSDLRIMDLQSMEESTVAGDAAGAFSPDGMHIAATRGNGFVIRRVSDGETIAQAAEHGHETVGVAYSPDGKLIASASLDQTVLLWDSESLQVVAELREHDLGAVYVAFTRNGQRLVSGGRDGKICVWNLADVGQGDWPIKRREDYRWNNWMSRPQVQVSCSPDGGVLATTRTKHWDTGEPPQPGVSLLSTRDLQEVRTIAELSGVVSGVLYSPVEDLLAIANQQGALDFFKTDGTPSGAPIVFAEGHRTLPVRFTPDGKRLLVVVDEIDKQQRGPERTWAVYSVSDRTLIASWSIADEQHCGTISPDGELVVTGHNDGLRFWPLEDLQNPTHVLAGGLRDDIAGLIWSVDFSPDGAYVVGGANLTGRIEIVDVRSKKKVGRLAGHVQHIGAVRFSPDGRRLASGGHTSSDALRLWDFESRREILSLTVEGARSAGQVEWLHDGNSIMLVTGDDVISIWRAPSLDEIERLEKSKIIAGRARSAQ